MFVDATEGDYFRKDLGFNKSYKVKVYRNLNKAKIRKLKSSDILIAEGGKNNREILENKNIDVLLSPEKGRNRDFLHHRNSGLNHVLCKLAKKNDIAVGIDFSDLIKDQYRYERIGRIMQNIKLCRKYKVNVVLGSFAKSKHDLRNAQDLISFAKVIGMTAGQAKSSLSSIERIKRKKEENKKIIGDGVRKL